MRERERVISGSRLGLFGECPASFKQCQGAPDIPGPAAERGNTMHAALHDPGKLIDLPEMDRAAVEWCREVRDESCNKFLGVPFYGAEGKMYTEHYFEQHPIPGVDKKYWPDGTADGVKIHGVKGYIDDFKTGRAEFAEGFALKQGACYAMFMFRKWSFLREVVVAIIHAGSMERYWFRMAREDYLAVVAHVTDIIKECLSEEPRYNPSTYTCTRCPGVATCPVANSCLTVLKYSGDIATRIGAMEPEERAEWYEKAKIGAKVADGIISAMKEYAKSNPGSLDGYHYKESERRRLSASKERIAKALGEHGVPLALVDTAFRASLSSLESVYRKSQSGSGKKNAEISAEFKAIIEPLCERTTVQSLRKIPKKDK